MVSGGRYAVALWALVALLPVGSGSASAKIVRIEIEKTEPAYNGQSFGEVGAFERVVGKAYGEVDPKAAANVQIQDLKLAPVNPRGMVEYVTDIDILRPKDPTKGNGVLLLNVVNRGNKGATNPFNAGDTGALADLNNVTKPGDGFLERSGYTIVWFGWQADLLPGNGRMLLKVPVAHAADGGAITGIVRSELTTLQPIKTLNLSSGWFTGLTHDSYPTVSLDNRTPLADGFLPTLTVRAKEAAPRDPIPNSDWGFASCTDGTPEVPDLRKICLHSGFEPGKLYELIYRAKDPLVLGLGFAAARDLAAFLKSGKPDDAGHANPVLVADQKVIAMGTSQSGRFIRSFIHLGFNAGENGAQVFDGAMPHIGGGMLPLSLRFAQPGRAWGEQIDHWFPAYDFPFTYAHVSDPLTGRAQGIYDRCTATNTCPKLFHVASALEMWEGRQSLGLTDPMGTVDVTGPASTRMFLMASAQHAPVGLPLPTTEPFSVCSQQSNPNPHTWTMRALLSDLTAWVRDGTAPPESAVPKLADGTLVSADLVRFPTIPTNTYGGVHRPAARYLGIVNTLHPLDFGPEYDAADGTGVITKEPPLAAAGTYGIRVPQVDTDGIDIGGIRDVYLGAAIGTYTGWNLFRPGRYEDGFCNFNGSFIPFAKTKAERQAVGDSRLSLEERYPSKEAYVAAVKASAEALVAKRFLLPDDAKFLIDQAEKDGIRSGP